MSRDISQHQRVREVFQAALDRPVSERDSFVRDVCAGEMDLRREVESLLGAHAAAGHFMERPALDELGPSSAAAIDGPFEKGTRVGPYEILGPLGNGGMGVVLRARDGRLNREVAIKVLPASFARDPERTARFEREARLLAALNHPHIAALYGLEESDGYACLVMELVDGPTLADRLAKTHGTGLPLSEALPIAQQIAEALEAAHEKGIVHRDLKPGNVAFTPEGQVKVLDFGLAKALVEAPESDLANSPTFSVATNQGVILGTAAYMSPEQAKGLAVDRRSDMFSFGCVLYEMLVGRRAFGGETVTDTLAAVLKTNPDLNQVPTDTPPALQRLLRRLLEKDRTRRLQSAGDARLEIEEAIAEPVAPVAGGARWRIAAAASLLAAILLAGLAALFFRQAVPELAVSRFEIATPPTFESVSFALSPDGRQLVFIANAEGQQKLWIRPLDQTQAQPLAGTEGAIFPFWAPDSRSIGFFADGKLKRLDLSGGQPLVLADAPVPIGGSWGSDGTILFAPLDRLSTTKLMRVAATGGVAVKVPVGVGSPRLPEFLPDGRHFLFFFAGRSTADGDGVYLGALDAPEVRRILAIDNAAAYAPPGYLFFVRQGALMAVTFDASSGTVSGEPVPVAPGVNSNSNRRGAFSISSNGLLALRAGVTRGRQLTWFDRAGKIVGTMGPPDRNAFASPELAPDGQRVAIARIIQGSSSDVWLLDAVADVWTRFTFNPRSDNYPVWAPDGSRLVFTSNRDNGVNRRFTQFFEKRSDGSGDERLLFTQRDSHAVRPADWSRDGRTLLYSNEDPTTGDIDLWALPVTGDRMPFPVVQTPFLENEGQFSPDGRWIAYRSNQSGREEIYVQAFPAPGGHQQVSSEGGSQPRWRRDGKELFYVAPDNMLMVASIGSAIGQRLSTGKPVPLFRTRLEAGDQPKQQYTLAPDGRRFLMNVIAEEANVPPITIVQNWTVGLKR